MKRAADPKTATAKNKKPSSKAATVAQHHAAPLLLPAPWWMWAVLVGVSFIAYANSLENYFVVDDKAQILMNTTLRDPNYWPKYFTMTVWEFIDKSFKVNYYRPLFVLSYWALFQSFGTNAGAYHFASVLLHTFNVLMLFILISQIFRDRGLAFVAALVFAAHSIHSEAVHWIAALGDLECLAFLLLSLWCYLRAEHRTGQWVWVWGVVLTVLLCGGLLSMWIAITFRFGSRAFLKITTIDVLVLLAALLLMRWCYRKAERETSLWFWGWSMLSAVMLLGGLLSKEMAVTFIGILALYEHFWRNPEPLRNWQAHLRGARAYAPHLVAIGIYVLLRFRIVGAFSLNTPEKMSMFTFIMTNISFQGRYWWKMLFPYPLRFWYSPQKDLITSWWAPSVWLSAAFFIGYAVLVLRLRAHRRMLLACFLWMTVLLSPAMNLTGIGPTLFTERYLYIPSVGACLLLAYGWTKLRALKWGHPRSALSAPKVAAALLVVVISLYVAQLWQRGQYFRNAFLFYPRELKYAPDASFLHFWLGNDYFDMAEDFYKRGYQTEAMSWFDKAYEQYQLTLGCPGLEKDTLAMAYLNMGNVYGRRKQYNEALETYKKSIAVLYEEPRTHYLLAYTYVQLGRNDEARRALQETLRLRPDFADKLQPAERNMFLQLMQQLRMKDEG